MEMPSYEFTSPQPVDKRRKRSDVDDVSKEYTVDVFGEALHLILDRNKDILSHGCVVKQVGSNFTKVTPCRSEETNCFFTGSVGNHSNSWVAATICGGVHAMVGLPERTVVLQPIKSHHVTRARRDTNMADPHIVYVLPMANPVDEFEENSEQTLQPARAKRATGRRYVETTVVVDHTSFNFHGSETEKVMAKLFLDPSLQSEIHFSLNKLMILEHDEIGLDIETDFAVTLDNFCMWQTSWNPSRDSDPEHSDYVILLTRRDLELHGVKATAGLARKGMCGLRTKCSVVEENGLATSLILAHETGHVLGLQHDGEGNECEDGKNIMAKWSATGPEALKWSSCSARDLRDFLSSTVSGCLDDAPSAGTEVSADSREDVCGSIVCRPRPDTGIHTCIIYSAPRMDGTECGDRKWCLSGKCVDMGPGSPEPVHGAWSDWEAQHRACSRTCGGGVKVTKRRYCNNPVPRYGGRPCTGSDVLAELCNVQECPLTSQLDFLSEQCARTDSRPIQGNRKYHWIPNIGLSGDDGCKINCQAETTMFFMKRGINVDGTECLTSSPSEFGRCERGHFVKVVDIPAESSGVTISQKNKYCWLSVTVNGESLFAQTDSRHSGFYTVGGVTLKYNSRPERITIIGPVKSIVTVQVFQKYGNEYVGVEPDVEYEYHVPTSHQSTNYMWKTRAGTCSKSCGTGTQSPVITCESSVSGTVDDYNCNIAEKPRDNTDPCNTHACPPRWRVDAWGECSRSCGGGQRNRAVDCVEENSNVESVIDEHRCQGQQKPRASATCNIDACPAIWKVGAWSQCSESCSRGTKTRTVECFTSEDTSSPVADSNCFAGNKPSAEEYCVVRPCNTDIVGSACKDSVDDCFGLYGEAVCTGGYRTWALKNCMKSCGVCSTTATTTATSDCKDEVDSCGNYADGFCTSSQYGGWAQKNCAKFCGLCTTTITVPSCKDEVDNCDQYAGGFCTSSQYGGWALKNCAKFCGHCTTTGCSDVEADCAAYGSGICTEYRPWASKHCQAYCGLCGARRKRDLRDILVPPKFSEVPPTLALREENMGQVPPKIIIGNDVISAPDDVMLPRASPEDGPSLQPLCNTVRTASVGSIDVKGKLLKGEECEQVVAVDLHNRVKVTLNMAGVDCTTGDELTIKDGVTQKTFSACTTPLQTDWLSDGNIVILKFKAGVEGHGHSFRYTTVPQNITIPACRQHFTSAVGKITSNSYTYPYHDVGSSDVCEIYVTGTPGKNVQLVFDKFDMTDGVTPDKCVKIWKMAKLTFIVEECRRLSGSHVVQKSD
ncbi:ATS16-like protein [Mya arenaria]|uniref:ATS16-like protein n=1 Tax=Mya arenaria TaxID=6604 RepID=A0ABY7GCH5_MYAAR|nr:ATS16-like protein [Mya arenaria]